jgi:hypothetical protein
MLHKFNYASVFVRTDLTIDEFSFNLNWLVNPYFIMISFATIFWLWYSFIGNTKKYSRMFKSGETRSFVLFATVFYKSDGMESLETYKNVPV